MGNNSGATTLYWNGLHTKTVRIYLKKRWLLFSHTNILVSLCNRASVTPSASALSPSTCSQCVLKKEKAHSFLPCKPISLASSHAYTEYEGNFTVLFQTDIRNRNSGGMIPRGLKYRYTGGLRIWVCYFLSRVRSALQCGSQEILVETIFD